MKRSNRSWAWVPWLLPVAVVGALALAATLLANPPRHLVAVVLGALLVVTLGWIVASVLWPARADRRCPGCGNDSVERADVEAAHGLVCHACGWHDEASSAWILAEDDGLPLEGMVLEQRKAPAQGVDGADGVARGSNVDTRPADA